MNIDRLRAAQLGVDKERCDPASLIASTSSSRLTEKNIWVDQEGQGFVIPSFFVLPAIPWIDGERVAFKEPSPKRTESLGALVIRALWLPSCSSILAADHCFSTNLDCS